MAGRERRREPLPPGFGSIWSSVVIDLIGWGIVLPILPLYAEDFTRSATTIGLLVASFSVMQLLFAPVWGRVSDRYGRKPVLVVSLAGTAVGSLIMGLAPSLAVLFLGRIIDGISGGSISAAQAAVADLAAPEQRARLMGLLGAAFGIGFVAGPALGGLAALGGDHVPFLVAAALAATNAVVAQRRLPETHPSFSGIAVPASPPPAPRDGQGDEEQRAMLRRLVVLVFIALTGFTAFEGTFALLGQRRFGLGLAGTGVVFTFVGLAIALFQGGLVHTVVTRVGEVVAVRIGLVSSVVGFAVLATAETWPTLVVALVLVTFGQGMLTPALTALVAGWAPRERRGATLGVQQAASALARVVGPIIGGLVFQHIGVGAPSVIAIGCAVTGLLLLPGVRPRNGVGATTLPR
jgi:DHA1 family tetracycline resistance protein-like MFS transporter